jgi:enoyl-CoA hydratase
VSDGGSAVVPTVLTELRDGVLVITLNRPEVRNAVDFAMSEGIAAAVDQLDADDRAVVGVLTGAGSTFCAGMDLKAFLRGERPMVPGRGFAGFVEHPPVKPLIAAVEGHALAGGCELVLACDLAVIAEDVLLGIPETRRGLVAAGGGLLRLCRQVPPRVAMELALTGRPVGARRALELGLVNRITATGGALAGALELAREIAANGPVAVRLTKQILGFATDQPVLDGFDVQRPLVRQVLDSTDAREGARAFAEGRDPVWRGC